MLKNESTLETIRTNVLIVGGGFAGLHAAQRLGSAGINVTLIDKQNYHLFQPLLYQVATGYLAPSDITSPLRATLSRFQSVNVVLDEVTDIFLEQNCVQTLNKRYCFEFLILATGVTHSYFGNDEWQSIAPGLKTVNDSIELRSKILRAFELAEQTSNPSLRSKLLTFIVVGGGPTGVELSGALAELTRKTMKNNFRKIDPAEARIILCEGSERILGSFDSKISAYAKRSLEKLGVDVKVNTFVKNISKDSAEITHEGKTQNIEASTIIWAAGVKASKLSLKLKEYAGAELDSIGRVKVNSDLSLSNHPKVFVIGDLAHVSLPNGNAVPGLAPAAMQQGDYVAKLILAKSKNKTLKSFSYFDKGNMAVIGKGKAVAETGFLKITGFFAWMAWAFIHIYFLIEFENKLRVFLRWAWNYITNRGGSRIISNDNS